MLEPKELTNLQKCCKTWVLNLLPPASVYCYPVPGSGAFHVALVVKNLPANARDKGDMGSIPGSGRSPGGENGNLLQYSCLENPTHRGAWRTTVCGVSKSRAQLSMHNSNSPGPTPSGSEWELPTFGAVGNKGSYLSSIWVLLWCVARATKSIFKS